MSVKNSPLKWITLSVTKPPIWMSSIHLLYLPCLIEWLLLNSQSNNRTKQFIQPFKLHAILLVWPRTLHMPFCLVPLNIKTSVWNLLFSPRHYSHHCFLEQGCLQLLYWWIVTIKCRIFPERNGHFIYSHLQHLKRKICCFLHAFWLVQDTLEIHIKSFLPIGHYGRLWWSTNPKQDRCLPYASLCWRRVQKYRIKYFNLIRKSIQAVTLADIANADMNRISQQLYNTVKNNGLHRELWWTKVPTKDKTPPSLITLWKSSLNKCFINQSSTIAQGLSSGLCLNKWFHQDMRDKWR